MKESKHITKQVAVGKQFRPYFSKKEVIYLITRLPKMLTNLMILV